MVFVDASVIVAILAQEPDWEALIEQLEAAGDTYFVSPVVRMEATLSISRRLAERAGPNTSATQEMVAEARALVDGFIADLGAREAMITADIGNKAIDAAMTYGKIVGHPAALNMGDCYAYACTKAYRLTLAYKGNDFSRTDLA